VVLFEDTHIQVIVWDDLHRILLFLMQSRERYRGIEELLG
jgi:hypothetical protein